MKLGLAKINREREMNRRHFLGSLLGLAATPLIRPKSFFFFGETHRKELTLKELRRLIAGATIGDAKPSVIYLTKKQAETIFFKLWEQADKEGCNDMFNWRHRPVPAIGPSMPVAVAGIQVMTTSDSTEDIVQYAHAANIHRELNGKKRLYDDYKPAPWGILRADKHFL